MSDIQQEVQKEKAADEAFCSACGAIIKKEAEICPKCGVRQKKQSSEISSRWLTLFLLSIFLGGFGVDRFYVGKIGTGIIKLLLTLFSLFTIGWIWWLIDWILILTEKFTDKDGNVIKKE